MGLILQVVEREASEFYELAVLEGLKVKTWTLGKHDNGTSWRVLAA